jgi:hypothetical protein
MVESSLTTPAATPAATRPGPGEASGPTTPVPLATPASGAAKRLLFTPATTRRVPLLIQHVCNFRASLLFPSSSTFPRNDGAGQAPPRLCDGRATRRTARTRHGIASAEASTSELRVRCASARVAPWGVHVPAHETQLCISIARRVESHIHVMISPVPMCRRPRSACGGVGARHAVWCPLPSTHVDDTQLCMFFFDSTTR